MTSRKRLIVIFILSVSFLLQALFIFYFCKITALNHFSYVKNRMKNLWELSAFCPSKYKKLSTDENTVLFRLPAINSENTLIPGLYDHVAVIYRENNLMFALSPSSSSFRKHRTFYIKSVKGFRFIPGGHFINIEK